MCNLKIRHLVPPKKSGTYLGSTRQHIPQNRNRNIYGYKNLKPQKRVYILY